MSQLSHLSLFSPAEIIPTGLKTSRPRTPDISTRLSVSRYADAQKSLSGQDAVSTRWIGADVEYRRYSVPPEVQAMMARLLTAQMALNTANGDRVAACRDRAEFEVIATGELAREDSARPTDSGRNSNTECPSYRGLNLLLRNSGDFAILRREWEPRRSPPAFQHPSNLLQSKFRPPNEWNSSIVLCKSLPHRV